MGPETTCPSPGRFPAVSRLLSPLVPSDGKVVVRIAVRGIAEGFAHTAAVGGSPVGRTGAEVAFDIAGVDGGEMAASASAGAAIEPGIGVVVVAEGMLGIVVVGGASVAVGTARRRVGGPKMWCMGPGEGVLSFAPLVRKGPRRDLVSVRIVAWAISLLE